MSDEGSSEPEAPADGAAAQDPVSALTARIVALEAALAKKQPLWVGFLAPIALFVGALVIAGAVLYSRDDSSASSKQLVATAPAAISSVGGASGVPAAGGSLPATFERYAKEIGLDGAKYSACMKKADTSVLSAQLNAGIQLQVNGTPTFFVNNKRLVGAQPPAILDEVINAELRGSPTTLDGYSADIQALARSNPPYFQILPARPDITGAMIEGSPNARVVITEYSDFQCPFCKRWTQETLTRLRPRLGNDIALAFFHFPLEQIHPNAAYASLTATCAAEQGKFWQMHDVLFGRQDEWANLPQ